jgi:hypothetical protein
MSHGTHQKTQHRKLKIWATEHEQHGTHQKTGGVDESRIS